MSTTINTPAELDALPERTLLLDRSNVPLRRTARGWEAWNAREAIPAGVVIAGGAPLTVLYRPDAEPTPVAITAEQREAMGRALARRMSSAPDLDAPGWLTHVDAMLDASGIEVSR